MKQRLILLSLLLYAPLCISMESPKKKSELKDIYNWTILLQEQYSIEGLNEEIETILNQQRGKINEKEEVKMLYMKQVCLITQTAAKSAQEQYSDEHVNVKQALNVILLNIYIVSKDLQNILEKMDPFFEDDNELWPCIVNYRKAITAKIKSLTEQKLETSFELLQKISTINEEALSMAWKILFPNRRGG